MIIRDAEPRDAAAVAAMANGLAQVTQQGPGTMTAESALSDMIRGPGLAVMVGELDGRAEGYAMYSAAYESALSERGLYLSDLYVNEGARRSGLARALMAELARRCKAEGGTFLWWIVQPGNDAAARFYDELGAVTDPMRVRALVGKPFEALVRD